MNTVSIYHNILWSKYKGVVFGALGAMAAAKGVKVNFTQIAETEGDRKGLSEVDLSYHAYKFDLLFKGSYSEVGLLRLCTTLGLRILLDKSRIVILPGYERPEFWVMLLAAKARGKAVAVFCDSTMYDRPRIGWKSAAKRFFFSLCDGIFTYGVRGKEYVASFGISPEKIYFRCQAAALAHGYEPSLAYENRVKIQAKGALVHQRFLYVGRLSEEKGLDSLLRAFSIVRNNSPESVLVLVGSGPLLRTLQVQAEQLGISEAVKFAGGMDSQGLAHEYASATCLVLPSRSEPWGLVVNEALSYGCPVVVSNICGCVPELVIDGVTGCSFQVDNVDELADKMMKVAKDASNVEKVATACISHIAAYSPARAADCILEGCTRINKKGG